MGVTTYPINHPNDHLTLYQITPLLGEGGSGEPTVARRVLVSNQFGIQTLYTAGAEDLAVPTGKALLPTTTPPTIPTDLDHYKC